ncbi:YopX family protein [Bacillus licheniformis]|uniref:YopX family protein n=1 Tax=Bacillus licheniformis TaxID=1402 RepID=UPI00095A8F2C|nr:YopX family protein [Bacillus licheniformis]OLF99977.1 hypothetical protein B4124_4466 [Bacillus licheniformis]
MREIKFRGMGINGEWYTGNLSIIKQRIKSMGIDPGSYISNKAGVPFAFSVRPETVGQFAGLKDETDREIWEGDVVKFKSVYYENKIMKAVVKFKDSLGSFVFDRGDDQGPWRMDASIREIEVIGNIYQNPNLLLEAAE